LLNIAGLGPIFGALLGAAYGPVAFLWITFGGIFIGAMHDFVAGVISLKMSGLSLPEIIGKYLGNGTRSFMRVATLLLMVLVGAVFMSQPAEMIAANISIPALETPMSELMSWEVFVVLMLILLYYVLATVMPIDKLIGRFYPIFGMAVLLMAVAIFFALILNTDKYIIPELTSLRNYNANADKFPIVPMLFITIACGAISGFHSTQSPVMARCMTNERQGRWIFYGAMVAEGILALIWAAAAGTMFADPEAGLYGIDGLQAFAAAHPGENIAALVVDKVSRSWLGAVGEVLAIIGVIAAPITSGDTALRSARLIVSDFLHLSQQPIRNRLIIAIPLLTCVFGMVFVDFNVVWRYFAWTNQTLAVFTLWAGTVFLYKNSCTMKKYPHAYLISLIPAIFMTMVSVSYIFIAPEGFHFAKTGLSWVAYLIAGITTIAMLGGFILWLKKTHNS
jgi:carbon starvation protein CstA